MLILSQIILEDRSAYNKSSQTKKKQEAYQLHLLFYVDDHLKKIRFFLNV